MSQYKMRWSERLQRWGRATLLSSATLMGALTMLSTGSAQAVVCEFDPMGFTNCTYGEQWIGGGPGDLMNPGPVPPTITEPYIGQWFDTQLNFSTNYYPTDKQIKLITPPQIPVGLSLGHGSM